MTQIGPFLEPGGKPGRKSILPKLGGEPASTPERDGDRPRRLPVVGFWRRLGALIFDLLLIYLVFRVVSSAFREPLMGLGRTATTVSGMLVVAYFVVGASPVTKGATVGKFLVGIHVTRFDGSPPTWAQALARTALLFPFFVFQYLIYGPFLDPFNYTNRKIMELNSFLGLSLFFATALMLAFNPFKQGLHDHLVDTLVRPVRAAHPTFDEMKPVFGEYWRRYYKTPFLHGIITLVLLWGVLTWMVWSQQDFDEGRRVLAKERSLLSTDALDETSYFAVGVLLRKDKTRIDTEEEFGELREEISDPKSYDPIHILLILGKTGAWPRDEELVETEARGLVQRYRQLQREQSSKDETLPLDHREETITNVRYRANQYTVVMYQSLDLFVFPYNQSQAYEFSFEYESIEEPPEELLKQAEEDTVGTEDAVDKVGELDTTDTTNPTDTVDERDAPMGGDESGDGE